MTLNYNPLQATVVTYTQTKINAKYHLIEKVEWKQTEEQTDGADCITFLDNVVVKDRCYMVKQGVHKT